MMEIIQRDRFGILDGMLVAINPNDKRYLNQWRRPLCSIVPAPCAHGTRFRVRAC